MKQMTPAYGYNNNRHLVSSISYSAPSGITAPATVNLSYDAVGNRTSTSDESGILLAEHTTTTGYNLITWQHKNPMTGSWIETSASDRGPVRSEVDPMGRDVGLVPPPNPPAEPTSPPTRSPMYLENAGGQTNEAELGMQLYEDFYINKNYGGGYGPGQGGFWEQWYHHAANREG